ncbi:monooxygenase [Fusarium globosum]|uniref:Monooxygenase n=1 Tax=Fusarium globosum TaxID=78864 RepID=A0A8H5XWR3_9HYPO|nr:monooxygenase [Fusarium globosum]
MGINSSNPAHEPAIIPPQTMDNKPVLDQKPTADKVVNGSTSHANGVHETFTCKDAPVENQRPLKVRVIGAGYSGVYLGIRIPQRLRNIDLKIYEKNEGVGGTWWENRYPGCACDIPSHSYQYTFAPNKAWSGFYAPAHEICAYIDGVAEKYGAKRFIHLGHRVTSATWNDTAKKWHVAVETNAGESFSEEVDVVVAARGNLNTISWPNIPGFDTFKGKKMHSAAWDQEYDFKNKNIGVIGGGSSSIQIVPELQKVEGAKLNCFVRSKVWISNRFGDVTMKQLGWDPSDIEFSAARLAEFVKSDDEYLRFRKRIEDDGNLVHLSTLRGSDMQKEFVAMFSKITNDVLASRPDLLESFSPGFGVGCRRLTPGPGYLEALSQPNVNFITQGIESINETGLKLTGPESRQVDIDVLVCATGFQTNYTPPFPVVGKYGVTLKEKFDPFPATYLTMTVDGFPNYFMMLGPNSAIGAGSLTCLLEAEGDYIVKCIRKLQKEDYVTMAPKVSRVQDFADYIGEYFKKTVYMDDCKSWYKIGGGHGDKISALWPGSVMHALEALRAPRWEDFEFEEMHDNRLRWLGNGWSMCVMEEEEQGDPSWYVNPDVVDVPPEGRPERDPKYLARPFSY